MPDDNPPKLTPVKVTCHSTDCKENLHCFLESKKMKKKFNQPAGTCQECGADLVNWERIHMRTLEDMENTFNSLRYELIRHHYWHKEIDQRAINHATRKGRILLYETARNTLTRAIGPSKQFRDGTQTPLENNIIYYAQHATACCCRKCLELWHGIPKNKDLSDDEIDYFSALVMKFIEERMPNLKDQGKYVPPIRKIKGL